MSRFYLSIAGLLIALAFSAGCGPHGDDDDDNAAPHTLQSGTYAESSFEVLDNGCNQGFEPATQPIDVVVTETTVTIEGETELDRNGNTLTGTVTDSEDLRPDFDCALDYAFGVDGTVPADNTFDVVVTYDIDASAGADCESLVGATLPCQSKISASYSLVTE